MFIDKLQSPRGEMQPFIWAAKYEDGSALYEFDDNSVEHSFYDIDKQQLKTFGLIGCGHKLFFDVSTGSFCLPGNKLDLTLMTNNGERIKITNAETKYNDVITYKSAYSDFAPNGKTMGSKITGYYFGYKTKIDDLHIKVILAIIMNKGVELGVSITGGDKDIYGDLVCLINDNVAERKVVAIRRNTTENICFQLK